MMLLSFQDIVSLWMKTNVFTRCDLVLATLDLYSGRTLCISWPGVWLSSVNFRSFFSLSKQATIQYL
jgi:hypothetical protein